MYIPRLQEAAIVTARMPSNALASQVFLPAGSSYAEVVDQVSAALGLPRHERSDLALYRICR